ncbi:restriction endonuclease [Mesorhizobium sp. M0027]|uniref:restriction endonuclease n=1 Tax=Mesorhizobium sp. M0027 TaxID=2956848 RepID=UPI003339DE65
MSIQATGRRFKSQPPINSDRYRNPDNDPRGPYLLADLTMRGLRPLLQYEWRGRIPSEGRHWRFTFERAEAEDAGGRIVWPDDGQSPRLKRYFADVADEREPPPGQEAVPGALVECALRSMLQALAQEIVRSPDYLVHVEWRDLERLLGEILSVLGFEVVVTRPGRDGGFDLELRCIESDQPAIYLVEIKHWTAPSRPSPDILERFFEVVVAKRASRGLLLSSSGYSAPALSGRSEIARQLIRLGNADKIVGLCQSYVRRMHGTWTPTHMLPKILFADTY